MNKLLHSARAKSRRSRSTALCAIALLSFAPAVRMPAQGGPGAGEAQGEVVVLSPFVVTEGAGDTYNASEAISAVRVRAPLLETASSISVITRSMMDDIAPNRVFDVTRYVAGVQEGRGIQFQDRMIIRGFETQNGARTVDNFLQSADADNIEESVIERIEVSKGPNAILSPAGAPGGSLNIITKSPRFRKARTLTAQIGLFDSQKLMLDMTGPLAGRSDLAYRMIFSFQDSERYWGDDSYIKGAALAPMFTWQISKSTQLTVKLVAAQHEIWREPLLILAPGVTASTKDPFLLPGISPDGPNGIQPWSQVSTHSADLFAVLTSSINRHIDVRVAANGRYYFEDSFQNFLSTPGLSNRYNPATGELTQDYTWTVVNGAGVSTYSPWINIANIPNRGDLQATRRRTANLQADAVARYQFDAVSSQTVVGVAYSRQLGYGRGRNGTMPGINLLNPNYNVMPVFPSNFAFYNRNTYANVQAYINQRLGFIDDRLFVTGGLMRYDTKTVGRNVLTGAAPSILDDSKDLWSLSALFKITPSLAVYASRSNNASPVIANNQPLWRSGEQDEIGFKSEHFNKRLSLNVAWFNISQTNVTVPNPAYQTDPTQPQTLISDLSNEGYEFELMGQLNDQLSIVATYSHLKMRDSLGRMVRGVADDNATLLLNYRFGEGRLKGLSTIFGIVHNGRRAGDIPDGNFTQLNVVKKVSFYLKPQYTTTLGFNYKWSEKLTTRLTIDNILDNKNHISVAGGRITGTGLTTQPGRNFRLTTSISF